jgi:hypothetical protein
MKTQTINNIDYIECNLVMLPTDKSSKLYLFKNLLEYDSSCIHTAIGDITKQHLYITSNEVIKEGNWILSDERDNIFQNEGKPIWKLEQVEKITNEWLFVFGRPHEGLNPDWCKKVIATTDSSLNEKIEMLGTGSTYIFNLPNISISFINQFTESYNQGNMITKVLAEVEYLQTMDEKAEYFIQLNLNLHNEISILTEQKQSIQVFIEKHNITEQTLIDVYEEYIKNALEEFNSKTYTRDEVISLFKKYLEDLNNPLTSKFNGFDNWIQNNLN